MTIGELKEYLNTITDADDLKCDVVRGSYDHSLCKCSAEVVKVERTKRGRYSEYFTDNDIEVGSSVVLALLVD